MLKTTLTSKKMAIFDMDNTLLQQSFIRTAAQRLGFTEALQEIAAAGYSATERTRKIAQLLKGSRYKELLVVVESIPVVEDAAAVVRELKKKGYICGIISDSYTHITEYVKNKLGMDFSCANELEFDGDTATGNVYIPANFRPAQAGDCAHEYCKCNMMRHISSCFSVNMEDVLAIGDGENDVCMISKAGTGVAFNATHLPLNEVADFIVSQRSFRPVLEVA
ncbi:HAD-IB family phosphatase [Chitinophaga lutea]